MKIFAFITACIILAGCSTKLQRAKDQAKLHPEAFLEIMRDKYKVDTTTRVITKTVPDSAYITTINAINDALASTNDAYNNLLNRPPGDTTLLWSIIQQMAADNSKLRNLFYNWKPGRDSVFTTTTIKDDKDAAIERQRADDCAKANIHLVNENDGLKNFKTYFWIALAVIVAFIVGFIVKMVA